MQSIVAIDIESTGLSPDRDAIIEIGAVKFKGHRVEAEWSSLINPNRHIPEFITGLTGINDAEVRNAPRFREVVEDLAAFVGDSPIVGHSIRFDLGFLQAAGLSFSYQEVIDTYELASVLMPTASRYNLGALEAEVASIEQLYYNENDLDRRDGDRHRGGPVGPDERPPAVVAAGTAGPRRRVEGGPAVRSRA